MPLLDYVLGRWRPYRRLRGGRWAQVGRRDMDGATWVRGWTPAAAAGRVLDAEEWRV